MANVGDTNLIKIAKRAIDAGKRIEASDLNGFLRDTADWYIASYCGDNSFVNDLRRQRADKRGRIALDTEAGDAAARFVLSDKQYAAALRVAVTELRPALVEARRLAAESAPKIVTGTPAADARIAETVAAGDGFYLDLRTSAAKTREEAYGTPELTPAVADAGEVAPAIPNGFYTVLMPDAPSGYYTIRITDADLDFFTREKPGTQVASVLTGPDNTTSYTGFAFVVGRSARVWSKKSGDGFAGWRAALDLLLGDFEKAASEYVKRSGRCFVCNRPLTTPESIARKIGPVCAKKIGASGIDFDASRYARLVEAPAAPEAAIDAESGPAAEIARYRGAPRTSQRNAVSVDASGRSTNASDDDASRSAQEEIDDLFA